MPENEQTLQNGESNDESNILQKDETSGRLRKSRSQEYVVLDDNDLRNSKENSKLTIDPNQEQSQNNGLNKNESPVEEDLHSRISVTNDPGQNIFESPNEETLNGQKSLEDYEQPRKKKQTGGSQYSNDENDNGGTETKHHLYGVIPENTVVNNDDANGQANGYNQLQLETTSDPNKRNQPNENQENTQMNEENGGGKKVEDPNVINYRRRERRLLELERVDKTSKAGLRRTPLF